MIEIYRRFYSLLTHYKKSKLAIKQLSEEEIEFLLKDPVITEYFGKTLKTRLSYLKSKLGKIIK